jgi:hypothetical protein
MPPTPPDARVHLRWVAENLAAVLGRRPRLDQAIAFVAGFDAANGYALLRGFQEWLVVQLGTGFEIHWFGLARCLAHGVQPPVGNAMDLTAEEEAAAVQRFFALVLDFLELVDDRDGRRRLYLDFEGLRSEQ